MQVTETLNEGLKRGYAITVPATELEAKVTEKLEEARKDFQMKGFRKGKAPAALMKKMFGKSVLGEAMQESIDEAMREHFEATGDRPALQPEVKMTNEDWKEGQDVEVSMTYEALPQVPEVALRRASSSRSSSPRSRTRAVDEALTNLAASAKDFEDRKKGAKAKDGDQVVIDFKGSVDGEAFEGGAAEDFPLVLGSGSFIPGFEDQLVGVKAGDETRGQGHLPRGLRRQEPRRQGGDLRGDGEGGEGAEAGRDRRRAGDALRRREPRRAQGADPHPARRRVRPGQPRDPQAPADGRARRAGRASSCRRRSSTSRPGRSPTSSGTRSTTTTTGHDHGEIAPTDGAPQARRAAGAARAAARRDRQQARDHRAPTRSVQRALFAQARQYPGQERQFLEFVQKNPQALQQIRAPLFEEKRRRLHPRAGQGHREAGQQGRAAEGDRGARRGLDRHGGDHRPPRSLIPPAMDKVGVGVIGCGNISAAYLKAARHFPVLDVRAVADLDPAAAEARGAEFGMPAVPIEDAARRPGDRDRPQPDDPEGARRGQPPDPRRRQARLFREAARRRLRRGGRAARRRRSARGLRVGCAPDTFLGGAHQAARGLLDAGAIGTPVGGTAFFMCPGHERWHPNPDFYYEAGGGPVLDMGPYYITDLVNLLGPVAPGRGDGRRRRGRRGRSPASRAPATTIPVEVPTHVSGDAAVRLRRGRRRSR